MRKIFYILLFSVGLFFSAQAQDAISEASIDNSCHVKPATIHIVSGQVAKSFQLVSLISGNNCYSGAKFTKKGFFIKTASGDIVFKYSIDKNGELYQPNGKLNDLELGPGIYYLYVDGGKGAYIKLKYQIS